MVRVGDTCTEGQLLAERLSWVGDISVPPIVGIVLEEVVLDGVEVVVVGVEVAAMEAAEEVAEEEAVEVVDARILHQELRNFRRTNQSSVV